MHANQALQFENELLDALRGQIEGEELDRDRTVGDRVVRTEDRAERPRTDLMKNAKPPERVRWCTARRLGVQRELLQREGVFMVTRKIGATGACDRAS